PSTIRPSLTLSPPQRHKQPAINNPTINNSPSLTPSSCHPLTRLSPAPLFRRPRTACQRRQPSPRTLTKPASPAAPRRSPAPPLPPRNRSDSVFTWRDQLYENRFVEETE